MPLPLPLNPPPVAEPLAPAHAQQPSWARLLALTYGSLGVIYGDIGTSPLYVYQTVFSKFEPSRVGWRYWRRARVEPTRGRCIVYMHAAQPLHGRLDACAALRLMQRP